MTVTRNKKLFLLIFISIFCVKLFHARYLGQLTACGNPETQLSRWTFSSGDSFSYTGAMENLVNDGKYYFYNGKENIYAGRLPHYSIPYFIARQFLSKELAYDSLAILQLVIQVLAICTALLLCFSITKNNLATILLLSLFLMESNWTLSSIYASPESFTCSLIIFFAYAYFRYTTTGNKKYFFASSLLLALLVTLKAYFGLVFFAVGIHFVFNSGFTWKGINKAFTNSLLYSIPLLVLLSPWAIRNYLVFNKFIPLQQNITAGYNYSTAELAYRKYLMAWGGDFTFWEKTSAGCYFMPSPQITCEFILPNHVYTQQNGREEIEKVRSQYISLQKEYSDSLNTLVTKNFDALAANYREERPLRFYILTPLQFLIKFVRHSGSYYLPINSSNPCYVKRQLVLKLVQSGIYWSSLVFGFIGLLLVCIRLKNFVLVFLPAFILVFFPLLLRAVEWRYLRSAEPLLCLGTILLFYELLNSPRILKIKK